MSEPEFEGNSGFSPVSVLIAVLLTIFLGTASTYVALFISALPWPIVFSAITALALIATAKKITKKEYSINHVNVAHAGASIGGLVAAGVSFTFPAIIILGESLPSIHVLIIVSLFAALEGIAISIPVRRLTIDKENLPFPSGKVGAEVIKAGTEGGKNAWILLLFGAIAAIYSSFLSIQHVSAVSVSITFEEIVIIIGILPLLVAVGTGYILGPKTAIGSWLSGAIVGWLVLNIVLQFMGLEPQDAAVLIQRVGMGMVMGAGIGFLLLRSLGEIKKVYGPFLKINKKSKMFQYPLIISIVAIPFLLLCGLSVIGVMFAVAGSWLAATIAELITGETNIDPLEQFGILIGLFMSVVIVGFNLPVPMWERVTVIGYVSIAAAVAGDIGHDYRAAKELNTRVIDIIKVDSLTAIVAAIVVPVALIVVLNAYGPVLLAPTSPHALQSHLVALSLELSPSAVIPFIGGALIGIMLEAGLFIRERKTKKKYDFSVMAFGVGMFIGWHLSIPVSIGGIIRGIISRKRKDLEFYGIVAAGGIMGGEGIVGFLRAFVLIIAGTAEIYDLLAIITGALLAAVAIYTIKKYT